MFAATRDRMIVLVGLSVVSLLGEAVWAETTRPAANTSMPVGNTTIELTIEKRVGPIDHPRLVEEKTLSISSVAHGPNLDSAMKTLGTAMLDDPKPLPVAKPATVQADDSDAIPDDVADTLDGAIKAYETKLAVIAHNVANARTVGYKRQRVLLEDSPYRHDARPGVQDAAGQYAAHGASVGSGSQVASIQTDMRQGTLQRTGRPLDLAIVGDGFFQVLDPASGETLYTRAGHLAINSNGDLVLGSATTGRLLEPAISIPDDATAVVVSPEGIVSVKQPGTTELTQVGQIELARFINPEGLLPREENLREETDASGPCANGNPGQDGFGRFRQGALEQSNVDLREELREWRETKDLLKTLRRLRR